MARQATDAMPPKERNNRVQNAMTSTLTMTRRTVFRGQFILPIMVGLLSVLAVFTATGQSDHPYAFTGVHFLWLVAGTGVLLTLFYPIDEHVRWAPVSGALALAFIYASVFVPGISAIGRPGSIQFGDSGRFVIQPAVLMSPLYLLWLVRFLPLSKHGGDVSWRRFGIYLCQCMLWWLPLMVIPEKGLLVAAVATFCAVYWIEGGHGGKAASGAAVAALVLAILLLAFKWLPHQYFSAQRAKEQWVVSMTLSQVSAFGAEEGVVKAQQTLPPGDENAVVLSMLESVGFVGAGFFMLVAGLMGWYAVRRAIRAETSVTTTVTIAAWLWITTRSLTYLITLLGWPRGIGVSCPVFNANGSDLLATIVILSAGLHKRWPSAEVEQSSVAAA